MYIGKNVILSKVKVMTNDSNNKIVIGDNCRLSNCILRADGKNSLIVIGRGTSMGATCIHAAESTSITIGRKCMFASEIDIRSGEHGIYNLGEKNDIIMAKT